MRETAGRRGECGFAHLFNVFRASNEVRGILPLFGEPWVLFKKHLLTSAARTVVDDQQVVQVRGVRRLKLETKLAVRSRLQYL